jgi:hypothetical protein
VALRAKLSSGKKTEYIVTASVALYAVLLLWIFWYNDTNFRIENKQNNAMWKCEWRKVADYAKDVDTPTRQIVMNKNIALFKLGVAGNEMFSYPDGSKDNAHTQRAGAELFASIVADLLKKNNLV